MGVLNRPVEMKKQEKETSNIIWSKRGTSNIKWGKEKPVILSEINRDL